MTLFQKMFFFFFLKSLFKKKGYFYLQYIKILYARHLVVAFGAVSAPLVVVRAAPSAAVLFPEWSAAAAATAATATASAAATTPSALTMSS
jgi:hypothetical protein